MSQLHVPIRMRPNDQMGLFSFVIEVIIASRQYFFTCEKLKMTHTFGYLVDIVIKMLNKKCT